MTADFNSLITLFNVVINATDTQMQGVALKNQTDANAKIEAAENARIKNIKEPTTAFKARTQLKVDSEQRVSIALKQAKFAWQLKVAPAAMPLLQVKSDHGMTVQKWLDINYPRITIIEDASGFNPVA